MGANDPMGFGVQRAFSTPNIPTLNGMEWFVDVTNGLDGNEGTSSDRALQTIQEAIDRCKDAAGDVIYVAPGGYAENLIVEKSGIKLVAAQATGNAKRVRIVPATGIALDVQAGALRLGAYGIRFVGVSGVGVKIAADGPCFDDCDFTSDTSHGLAFVGQASEESNTGSGAWIRRCLFRECGDMGIHVGLANGKSFFATNVRVEDSEFYLNTNADIGDQNEAGGQTYFSQWRVFRNFFMTRNKAVYLGMAGGSGTTELLVCGNYFAADSALNGTKIALPAGGVFSGNFQAAGVVDGSSF